MKFLKRFKNPLEYVIRGDFFWCFILIYYGMITLIVVVLKILEQDIEILLQLLSIGFLIMGMLMFQLLFLCVINFNSILLAKMNNVSDLEILQMLQHKQVLSKMEIKIFKHLANEYPELLV